MKRFVFFHGYQEEHPLLNVDWDRIMDGLNRGINPITTLPTWTGTTYTPTWVVNPGLIQYTPPNYTRYNPTFNTTTNPNYLVTTTPGTDYVTIPFSNTGTATGFSLTTSNSNGITHTTTGTFGTLTTNTATYSNSSFKLY